MRRLLVRLVCLMFDHAWEAQDEFGNRLRLVDCYRVLMRGEKLYEECAWCGERRPL